VGKELGRILREYDVCEEALEWAEPYETLAEAWNACERGDWMIWLAAKAELCTHEELVTVTCECAQLALPYAAATVAPVIAAAAANAIAAACIGVAARQVLDAIDPAADPADADADAAAYDIVYADVLRQCAEIVRKRILSPILMAEALSR